MSAASAGAARPVLRARLTAAMAERNSRRELFILFLSSCQSNLWELFSDQLPDIRDKLPGSCICRLGVCEEGQDDRLLRHINDSGVRTDSLGASDLVSDLYNRRETRGHLSTRRFLEDLQHLGRGAAAHHLTAIESLEQQTGLSRSGDISVQGSIGKACGNSPVGDHSRNEDLIVLG